MHARPCLQQPVDERPDCLCRVALAPGVGREPIAQLPGAVQDVLAGVSANAANKTLGAHVKPIAGCLLDAHGDLGWVETAGSCFWCVGSVTHLHEALRIGQRVWAREAVPDAVPHGAMVGGVGEGGRIVGLEAAQDEARGVWVRTAPGALLGGEGHSRSLVGLGMLKPVCYAFVLKNPFIVLLVHDKNG